MKPASKTTPAKRLAIYAEAEAAAERVVKAMGGRVTAKQVAAKMGWSTARASAVLQRMVTKGHGLVRKETDVVPYDKGRHWEISAYVVETESVPWESLPAWLRGAVERQINGG